MRKVLVLLVMVLALGMIPTMGQDDPPAGFIDAISECDDAAWDLVANEVDDIMELMRTAETDERRKIALLSAQMVLQTSRSVCDGLIFTSEEYGLKTVSDPVIIPEGIYRMRLESTSSFSVNLTELNGDCGVTFEFMSSDGETVETVSEVGSECVALLDFDGQEPWTLTYEPIFFEGN